MTVWGGWADTAPSPDHPLVPVVGACQAVARLFHLLCRAGERPRNTFEDMDGTFLPMVVDGQRVERLSQLSHPLRVIVECTDQIHGSFFAHAHRIFSNLI